MSKKLPVILAFILFFSLVASQAFAQGGPASTGMSDVAIKYISYFFALGIAVFGGTQAQSKAASVALEGIARNPAAADKHFRLDVTKVGYVEKSELNEEFYKLALPGKTVTTEEEFRAEIKKDIESYWETQSRNHLQHEIYHVLLDHTNISFPESFLKKWMQTNEEKKKSEEEVEAEFPSFVNQLKWTLIIDKIVRENNIEVLPEDLKAFAKQQLFGYMVKENRQLLFYRRLRRHVRVHVL